MGVDVVEVAWLQAGLVEGRPDRMDARPQVGRGGRQDDQALPFPVDGLGKGVVVIDLVYTEEPTPLLRAAAARGCTVIDGREVLMDQALGQFRMMTGREMPLDLARRILGLEPA